ncbi:MAG: heat-inducible transcriptional repressor HrcA [Christensenellales bacterium]|jgi:heat-inducible transcriptional repressor
MKLSDRKLAVLKAIIDDYVDSAVPVGSRTISRKYIPGFSPATIRNEMADLEEMGLLTHLHTSSGRIPSNKAYRMYVDALQERHVDVLTHEEVAFLRRAVNRWTDDVDAVIQAAAQAISQITRYTAMVLAPQLRRMTLRRIQLVGISRNTALVVIVTDAGVSKDAIIRIPEDMEDEDLLHISRELTDRFAGHSVTDVNVNMVTSLRREMRENRDMFINLMNVLEDASVQAESSELVLAGAANLLDYPEYKDSDRARALMTLLQAKDRLHSLMTERTRRGYFVTIGVENDDPQLEDCSLLTATYRVENRPVGAIGIIGPTRMDYARAFQALSLMQDELGEVFTSRNTIRGDRT